MEVASLIEKTEVQLRLLKQIDHFEKQRQIAKSTLNALPPELLKTAQSYNSKIMKHDTIINKLKVSYYTL